MKFFSFARSYQSLATHIKIFSVAFVGSLETSSKVRILAVFLVFLTVFRGAYLGTRPKLIMIFFFGNTALMYVLSRDIFDFIITLEVSQIFNKIWTPIFKNTP